MCISSFVRAKAYGRLVRIALIMERSNDADGTAALGICESLIIALIDQKIMSSVDARSLLEDVATTHEEAALTSPSPERHRAVVDIVQRILAGKNGTRRF